MDGSGECNQAHIQLIPQSLAGGGCHSGADLTFDKPTGKLVGKRGDKIVCQGDELAGATFTVRSVSATAVFTIANVRSFRVKNVDYQGFRVESGGQSMCDPAVAGRVLHELGYGRPVPKPVLPSPFVPDGFTPGFDDDLVIPLGGPLYDQIREVGRTIRDTEGKFFSLACVGDALAKLTLDGLTFPNAEMTETALSMITANYCGKPLTVRGMAIEWLAADRPFPHEASWQRRQAACIDTPRLMKLTVNHQRVSPTDLPRELQPERCYDESQGHGVCDEKQWIEALRTQCGVSACVNFTAGDLESYVNDGDASMIVVAKRKT